MSTLETLKAETKNNPNLQIPLLLHVKKPSQIILL